MTKLKKTNVLISLDEEVLLNLRRILFKNGLALQEFISYVVEHVILEDERMESLIDDLREEKSTDVGMKGGVNRRDVNADCLYEAIEERIKKELENENDTIRED
jgi:hypothetical protein